jgi:hypothetical protein
LNPLDVSSLTTSNGNLQLAASAAGYVRGTMNLAGKTYWETTITIGGLGGIIGVMQPNGAFPYTNSNGYHSGGSQYVNGSSVASWGAGWAVNDIIGIAVDADAGTITAYKNGASQGSKSISTTATWMPWIHSYDGTYNVNFGQRPFAYTAPSGFKALNTANLPAPVVTKPNTVFDTVLYTGNGSSQTITLPGAFSPDLVWIKPRSDTGSHQLFDKVRGDNKVIYSNLTSAEEDLSGTVSLLSDGFTVGTSNNLGVSSRTYAAWTWDAGTTTATNDVGSISSQVRANASAGFSVATWSTNSSSGNATIGHGLNVAPKLIIMKSRNATYNWDIYHGGISNAKDGRLVFTTAAFSTASVPFGGVDPTSTVFTMSQSFYGTGIDCVAYCWAPVSGYSSAFSFTGNGSSDGPFCFLGFRPKLLLIKRSDSTGNWLLVDSVRGAYNLDGTYLYANTSDTEATQSSGWDLLSNGFKNRNTYNDSNSSGATYIGFAWAENPFQYARAR